MFKRTKKCIYYRTSLLNFNNMKKETKKKKLEVENAIANWDGCVACMACYMTCVIYYALAGTLAIAGGGE